MPVRIQVLGPVRLWRGDVIVDLGPARRRAVLALLALAGGWSVSRHDLVNGLWPDGPPASATNIIQTHVKHLRRLIEPDRRPRLPSMLLRTVGDGYALDLAAFDLDLVSFRQLAAAAAEASCDGRPLRAAELFRQALRLWHGAPVADLPLLADHPKITVLLEERRTVLLQYGKSMIGTGSGGDVIAALEEMVHERPLDEAALATLIDAYRATGQRARAFDEYHRCRRQLAEELGVDPGPELTAAHAALLREADPGPRERSSRTLPSWTGPAQLPAGTAAFIDRQAELSTLDGFLAADSRGSVPIVAIDGAAGVGKTTLAVRWAHSVADRFPDGQLYMNLRGFGPTERAVSAAEAVRGFLEALGVSSHRMPHSVQSQVDLYRSLLAGQRMLVVLDNARDARQVRPLLPGASGCAVVITSRIRLTSLVAVEGARSLTLELMPLDSARRLLAHHVGHDRLNIQSEAADEVISLCGRLPLAVAIVAAHAATRPALSLATIADNLRSQHNRLDALADADETTDVRAVFGWSYRALGAPAAGLFRLLGLQTGVDLGIPAAAALAGVSVEEARSLLAELAALHLVTEHPTDRLRMHDLLGVYAAELARTQDPAQDRLAAIRRLLDHYLHTAHAAALLLNPQLDPITLPLDQSTAPAEPIRDHAHALVWFNTERHALIAAIDQAAAHGLDTHVWQLGWTLYNALLRQGYWHDLLATQQAGLAAAQRLRDPGAQAHSHRRLATALIELGHADQARDHFSHAMALYRELGEDANLGMVHVGLNRFHSRQGKHAEALLHACTAIELFTRAGHHVGLAFTLNLAAWELALLGQYQQALEQAHQALPLLQSNDDRHSQAATLDTIGYAYHHLGNHTAATDAYQQSLNLFREVGDRYSESVTLDHLGDMHHERADHQQAQQAWQQALNILDDLDHPDAGPIRLKLRSNPPRASVP
jgi:DNA-binding SARP family transcriptional activator